MCRLAYDEMNLSIKSKLGQRHHERLIEEEQLQHDKRRIPRHIPNSTVAELSINTFITSVLRILQAMSLTEALVNQKMICSHKAAN